MRLGTILLATVMLAGCGGPSSEPTLTVGVASSMADVMRRIEAGYGGAGFQYSVAGSQVLVAQVREGAPIDVVITADRRTAQDLEDLGLLAGSPARFAGNELAIAVAPGNPHAIADLEDLADPQRTIVLAAPQVPAGAYTRRMLQAAGVEVDPASLEPSVRSVLAKVELGEADAGIVYATDLAAAAVDGVPIDASRNVLTSYYAAVVVDSPHPRRAADLVVYLQGEEAAAALAGLGFLP